MYNAITTAISIALGLNLMSAFKDLALNMRWPVLSAKKRNLVEVRTSRWPRVSLMFVVGLDTSRGQLDTTFEIGIYVQETYCDHFHCHLASHKYCRYYSEV